MLMETILTNAKQFADVIYLSLYVKLNDTQFQDGSTLKQTLLKTHFFPSFSYDSISTIEFNLI